MFMGLNDDYKDMTRDEMLKAAYEDGVKEGKQDCAYKVLVKIGDVLRLLARESGGDCDGL